MGGGPQAAGSPERRDSLGWCRSGGAAALDSPIGSIKVAASSPTQKPPKTHVGASTPVHASRANPLRQVAQLRATDVSRVLPADGVPVQVIRQLLQAFPGGSPPSISRAAPNRSASIDGYATELADSSSRPRITVSSSWLTSQWSLSSAMRRRMPACWLRISCVCFDATALSRFPQNRVSAATGPTSGRLHASCLIGSKQPRSSTPRASTRTLPRRMFLSADPTP